MITCEIIIDSNFHYTINLEFLVLFALLKYYVFLYLQHINNNNYVYRYTIYSVNLNYSYYYYNLKHISYSF